MIRQVIFVRHGQSEANAAGVYAGARAEIQLTDLGREQAEATGRSLVGREISRIIASDFERAQATARIIAREIDYPEDEIVTDIRLREINVGGLTGQADLGFPAYLDYVASGIDDAAEGPEQVEARLRPFLESLEDIDGDAILVVAHAGIGRVLRSILTGVDIHEVAKLDIPNAKPMYLPLVHLIGETK